jgi:hypothetical protein
MTILGLPTGQTSHSQPVEKWFLIFLLSVFALKLFAKDTNVGASVKIGAADAVNHIGQALIVTGQVAEVVIRPKIVFLNLDRPYPNSPFTLIILPAYTNQFGDLNALQGKNVEATGIIKNYHGTPEMVLLSSNELNVVDSTHPPLGK